MRRLVDQDKVIIPVALTGGPWVLRDPHTPTITTHLIIGTPSSGPEELSASAVNSLLPMHPAGAHLDLQGIKCRV